MEERLVELVAPEGGSRLDRFLADAANEFSRSVLQGWIGEGRATVNGRPAKASYKVRAGDNVALRVPPPTPTDAAAEAAPLCVVYEDAALLIVDKPPGTVVHPAPGHRNGTLVNALLAHCPELAEEGGDRPGIVHRLDRDTSGLIVVAKSDPVRRALQKQFAEHKVHKQYLALVDGLLQPAWGRIVAPLGRDPRHRQKIAVQTGGREATTEYHVLEQFNSASGPGAGQYSLVLVEPETGRTHQIRVHLAAMGHPVAGDTVYGRRRTPLRLDRQFLHAWRIGFEHPTSHQPMELEAPLPADLASVLADLRGR